MCYHPNKQTGIGQLAGGGRITTPSSHLSSILMTERDKQSVNAPGVCVITRRTPAKIAHARACGDHIHGPVQTNWRGAAQIFFFFPYICQITAQRGGQQEREWETERETREGGREGVSRRGTTCFCPSFIFPASSGQWLIQYVSHTQTEPGRERIRAYFLKLLLGRGKCSAAA